MILVLAAALLASQDTAAIGRAVREGIAGGVYPGAVVVIGTADTVLFAAGYGHFTWSPRSPVPDPDSSLYDLASVTKVVATATTAMLLADRGRLSLSRPVQDYLPQFGGEGKSGVTVRHLLEHRSGMRAWLRLDTLARDSGAARLIVLADSLRWPPGTHVEYSDLNAMLLGWVIEAVAGVPLDVVAERAVFRPLGMTQTRYRPPRSLRPRIVPVGLWRGHPIAGELHDQNAARLGGVSGHAGLYSTGRDLSRFAQFWMRHGLLPDSTRLARAGAIDLFTQRGPGDRALGWEMRDTTERGSAGDSLSANAYGHTGFTGTSIWIDPQRDVFVILLTNRVFDPRHRRSIRALREIRANLADAAATYRETCRRPGC